MAANKVILSRTGKQILFPPPQNGVKWNLASVGLVNVEGKMLRNVDGQQNLSHIKKIKE